MKEAHRRTAALILAAGTLWTAAATAGSGNAASAAASLRQAASLLPCRVAGDGGLPLAAALALAETPLLYSVAEAAPPQDENAVENISGGESTETGENTEAEENAGAKENTQEEESSGAEDNRDKTEAEEQSGAVKPPEGEAEPLLETPLVSEAPSADNGVAARTLIPTGESGYTVCGRVYISSSRGDALSIPALREPFDAELTGDAPQVLILHSHGSEGYTPVPGTEVVWSGDSRTTDFRYSVVRVGDEIASVFEDAGITVLHDRTLYDYPDYSGSYDRSLAAINTCLAQYPSIRFILDVHRDYIADSRGTPYKVISEIEGVGSAAQLTLVIGSDGSGLPHPRWMENLKLATAIQEQTLSRYPTLMRPILLRKSRYNQHTSTGALLLEAGAAGNTPEEAALAARLFAQEMVEVLQARSK